MYDTFGEFLHSQTFVWVVLIAVFTIIEAISLGLTTIWFAGGALAASLLTFVTDNVMIQILVFLVVSLILIYFVRPIAKNKFNNNLVMTNIDAIIGSKGRAKSGITHGDAGIVRADNKDWTAILADDSESVFEGDEVTVVEVQGVKLIVTKVV